MKIKKDNGFTVVDVIIAVIAIMIFSTLIYSLMYTYVLENVKLKKETLAMIYMTEIFENIGIARYTDVTQENIYNLVPEHVTDSYNVEFTVEDIAGSKDIIKKIQIKLTYSVGTEGNKKQYTCSMERMKINDG